MDQPDEAEPQPHPSRNKKRCTDKELRERIEIVRRKLLTGETRKMVRVMITEEWGIQATQAYQYLKTAEDEIQEAAEKDRLAWLAEHIAIRREIRRKANVAQDLKSELAAAESEAKLLGLEPPTKLEHTGRDGAPIDIAITEIVIEHHSPGPDVPAADPAAEQPPADRDGWRAAGDPVLPGPDAGLEVHV